MFKFEFIIDREEVIKAPIGKGVLYLLFEDKVISKWFAVSGGYGNGEMDLGEYIINSVKQFPDQEQFNPYKKEGFPWGAPLTPKFKTKRTDILIHPDGNVYGSLGCVAIQKDDISLFYFIKGILMQQKLINLEVKKRSSL